MKSVLRICFYAILASLAVISISCGDDPKPVPEPATNTAIDAANVNTLVGNYKIKGFDAMGLMSSNDYSAIQDLVGQSNISISNDKIKVDSKAQIEGYGIDVGAALIPAVAGFKFITPTSLPSEAVSTTANDNGTWGTIIVGSPATPTNSKGTMIKVNEDKTLSVTQVVVFPLGDSMMAVTVTFILEKVNDAIIDLQPNVKYWDVKPINTTDAPSAMATLLSYYQIDNITLKDGSQLIRMAATADIAKNMNGNMKITVDVTNMKIDFAYKYQNGGGTDNKTLVSGVAKLAISTADINDILGKFESAGASVVGEYGLKIVFKASDANFTHDLGLAGEETITMNLTKLYDQNPLYPKILDITKPYWTVTVAP